MVYFNFKALDRLLEYYSQQPPNLSKVYTIERLLFKSVISTIRIEQLDSTPQEKRYQFRLCPFGTVLGNVFFSADSEKEMKRIRAFYDNFYNHNFKIIMADLERNLIDTTPEILDSIEKFVSPAYKPKTNVQVKEYIENNQISNLDDLLMSIGCQNRTDTDSDKTTINESDILSISEELKDSILTCMGANDIDKTTYANHPIDESFLEQYGTKIGKDGSTNDTVNYKP